MEYHDHDTCNTKCKGYQGNLYSLIQGVTAYLILLKGIRKYYSARYLILTRSVFMFICNFQVGIFQCIAIRFVFFLSFFLLFFSLFLHTARCSQRCIYICIQCLEFLKWTAILGSAQKALCLLALSSHEIYCVCSMHSKTM